MKNNELVIALRRISFEFARRLFTPLNWLAQKARGIRDYCGCGVKS